MKTCQTIRRRVDPAAEIFGPAVYHGTVVGGLGAGQRLKEVGALGELEGDRVGAVFGSHLPLTGDGQTGGLVGGEKEQWGELAIEDVLKGPAGDQEVHVPAP